MTLLELSETKSKYHKSTEVFKINGFQTPFRRDHTLMPVEVELFM